MRVLVTGATGFVGRHVSRALVAAGHEVVGLARKRPEAGAAVLGIEYADGDVVNAASSIREAFAGCDAVVHLVGIIREIPARGQTFAAVHVKGTRNVLQAALSAGTVGRFVYLSAIGSTPDAPSEYSRTKAQAEELVRNSEVPYTILRPSVILGPDGEFLQQMEELIRRPPLSPVPIPVIPVPGSGRNRLQPVFIDDLCTCVVRCLENPETVGQTYEIGGETVVTFDELVDAVAQRIGGKKPHVHIPLPLLSTAAAVMETLLPHPPITTDQVANMRRDSICDNGPMEDAVSINPLGLAQMLERIYRDRRVVDAR